MASSNPRRANGWRRDQLRARHRAAGEDCYICGRPIDYELPSGSPWSFVVDETLPVSRGGDPLSFANTHAAHRWCNRIKGTHTLQWIQERVAQIMSGLRPRQQHGCIMPYRSLGL